MNNTVHPAAIAISAVVNDAADVMRVPSDQISVETLEAREWSDSCLGLPQEDEACADVIIPGYLVVLGDGFVCRTDMRGNIRRGTGNTDRELRIHFRQSGGLMGWTSDYHADEASLSADDVVRLRQFIDETDFSVSRPTCTTGIQFPTSSATPSSLRTGRETTPSAPTTVKVRPRAHR